MQKKTEKKCNPVQQPRKDNQIKVKKKKKKNQVLPCAFYVEFEVKGQKWFHKLFQLTKS